MGFEAILPNSGVSNLLEDVTIPIKPLIDLGGSQMNAVAVEGADTPSIKVRINGRVDAPIRLVFKATGTATPTKTTAWASPPACPAPRPPWNTSPAAIPGPSWSRKANTTAACRRRWAAASSACPSRPLTTRSPKTMRPPYSPCKRRVSMALRPSSNGTWRIRCAAAPAIPSSRPVTSSGTGADDQIQRQGIQRPERQWRA